MLDIFNAIQLGMTFSFLILCVMLLYTWREVILETITSPINTWKAEQWLSIGIGLGFTAAFFDNLYWGVYWFADFQHWNDLAATLLYSGAVNNAVARQGLGVLSVCAHIYAAVLITQNRLDLNKIINQISFVVILGVIFTLTLTLI